jgi:hypothetical protein
LLIEPPLPPAVLPEAALPPEPLVTTRPPLKVGAGETQHAASVSAGTAVASAAISSSHLDVTFSEGDGHPCHRSSRSADRAATCCEGSAAVSRSHLQEQLGGDLRCDVHATGGLERRGV